MQVSQKEGLLLKRAIGDWQEGGQLSPQQAEQLRESLEITVFDWKRVAKYAFWAALACILIAASAVLADRWLMALFERLFSASDWAKCLAFAIIAFVFYGMGIMRKHRWPAKRFSTEALFFLGVIATAFTVAFLGEAISTGADHFSLLLLLAAILYGLLGLWFPSTLVWVFSMLSLASWFGAETGYLSGWGAYYLGMNVPLRFVFFGLSLLAASGLFHVWPGRQAFLRPTRALGLLYLFVALWLMSIFGNYGDVDSWQRAGQLELMHWSLVFALAALAAIYHGVRYDDALTRGFGLTFLFINLYTRFFEFFWDDTHKALFFGILAVSFWYLGSRAEQIWQLRSVSRVVRGSSASTETS